MPGALDQVLTYLAIPVIATLSGGALPLLYEPGPRLRSSVQHFAAGLVFAAVSAELLPRILEAHDIAATVLGFLVGVGLMLGIKWLSRRQKIKGASGGAANTSLVLAAGVDYLVDGLLIGIGFVLGAKSGGLLTFALSIEGMFLALGVSLALRKTGVTPGRLIVTAGVFGMLFAAG